jgi:hypothetical protein
MTTKRPDGSFLQIKFDRRAKWLTGQTKSRTEAVGSF